MAYIDIYLSFTRFFFYFLVFLVLKNGHKYHIQEFRILKKMNIFYYMTNYESKISAIHWEINEE